MKIQILYICLVIIAFYGCANPQPPPGGPRDTIPPVILKTIPPNKTTNFKGTTVTVDFSKYMDRNKVLENIFVSPQAEMDFDWSGKSLDIDFTKPLEKNTTYALTFGTDLTDYLGNKAAQSYTLTFSTGNIIDTGIIAGSIQDKNPAGVYIFAYNITNMKPDTLDPRHTAAQYRTQSGTNGKFDIHALKPGIYRVFGIRDEYKNGIYDEGVDAFGAPLNDVKVTGTDTPYVQMRIGPPIDRTPPMLFNAEALTNRRIAASFSENLNVGTVHGNSFALQDSLGRKTMNINAAYALPGNAARIEIITAGPLDTAGVWRLTALRDSAIAVRDSSGNMISDTANKTLFAAIIDSETTVPVINKVPFADSSRGFDPLYDTLLIRTNIGLNRQSVERGVRLVQMADSQSVRYRFNWFTGNQFAVVPEVPLKPDVWYVLYIYGREITGANGVRMADTTIRLRFLTGDTRVYSTVSGVIKDSLQCGGPYIVTITNTDNRKYFTSIAGADKRWSFSNVPPGTYSIEAFCDSDRNGRYSYGNAFPFMFGERYMIAANTMTVRARWNTENIIIDMNK